MMPEKSIYDDMVALGVEIGSHESDLYVPVTAETRRVLNSYRATDAHTTATIFISEIDKKPWYDIAFAFQPFWDKKLSKGGA